MSSKNNQPIELLKSGQLLAVTDGATSGIILQKPFFAEYIGPGAAIGGLFDLKCVTIYALGQAEFTAPATLEERQEAFRRRIDQIETMQTLCQEEVPLRRAIDLLDMLCDRFGIDEIRSIPNDVLAKVVGVLPGTIAMAWQKQFNLQSPADAVEEYDGRLFATAKA
ncbi:hypothetical protein [Altericista sp. CCNU0014]|uniref:hypothetical protein n=1 Tax=Altericista sp. CCNU0014 TaxID=3082949 RepID=UPI00384C677F